ncbi:MAG TPA: diguanylate cyclase [Methylophilus sp.]
MRYKFYESKILFVLISLIILIQISAFAAQIVSNRLIIEKSINEQLQIGAQVLYKLLESRSTQLRQSADVLVSDYAFRESVSIARDDVPTINSMLQNHGARAKAPLMILTDVQHQVIAAYPTQRLSHYGAYIEAQPATYSPRMGLVAALDNQLYQTAIAKVKSPRHIANLLVGYELNQAFANELRDLIDMDFFFIAHTQHGWKIHASTMAPHIAQRFIAQFEPRNTSMPVQIEDKDQRYLMLAMPIADTRNNDIFAIVSKPVHEVILPYQLSENILFYLLLITLSLSIIAIFYVTKKMVTPLNEQAHMDNLTGLGNRRLFNIAMHHAQENIQVDDVPFALLLLDLNKFKMINDNKGHMVGDNVLRITADRIKHAIRKDDSAFRLGGDEFVVILEDCKEAIVEVIAEKISQAILKPIPHDGELLHIQASIGIVLAPQHGDNLNILLKRADEAMYVAKSTNAHYCIYQNHDFI